MREQCVNAVNGAMQRSLGRDATPAELRNIESRISRHMRENARRDPQAAARMSQDERIEAAGETAAQEIQDEATRALARVEDRIVKLSNINAFIEGQIAAGKDQLRTSALDRIFQERADAGGTLEGGSIDGRANGIVSRMVASMEDFFEAGKRRGIWKHIPFNEPGVNQQLRRASVGLLQDVPPEFVQLARHAREQAELLADRFRAAGGVMGHLEDWSEPHRWSDILLIKEMNKRGREALGDRGDGMTPRERATAITDLGRDIVAREFADGARRNAYVHEDGRAMTYDEIHAFMNHALQTVISDGSNKELAREPAEFTGRSLTSNRHRAHRQIHLEPEAAVALLNRYSEMGAMESMLAHIRGMARDISLVETLGANADLTVDQLIRNAVAQDKLAAPERGAEIERRRRDLVNLYAHISGQNVGAPRPVLPWYQPSIRGFFTTLRSISTFAKLGMTVSSAFTTDPVIMSAVAQSRGFSAGQAFTERARALVDGTRNGRRWYKRAGLMTDTVMGYAEREVYDNINARDLSNKAASFSLRITGLNWVTEANRAGYAVMMMDTFGHLVRHNPTIEGLRNADDRSLIGLLNVSQETWDVWRAARLETRGTGSTLLTAQAIGQISDADAMRAAQPRIDAIRAEADATIQNIYRNGALSEAQKREAANRRRQIAEQRVASITPDLVRMEAQTALLGIIKEELNTAIITAGTRERATMLGESQAGTWAGEIRRSVMLFKSYPWTYMMRQWQVAQRYGQHGRWAYLASLVVASTLAGAIDNWLRDLASGRDPRSLNPAFNPEGQSDEVYSMGMRNWTAAFMRGGGAGFLADFLVPNVDSNARQQSLQSRFFGSAAFNDMDQMYELTLGNLNQEMAGQDSHAGAETVRYARSHFPNWWFSYALTDRLIWNQWMEAIEPGYIDRRTQREEDQLGSSYWWNPTEATPSRAPNLANIWAESPGPEQ